MAACVEQLPLDHSYISNVDLNQSDESRSLFYNKISTSSSVKPRDPSRSCKRPHICWRSSENVAEGSTLRCCFHPQTQPFKDTAPSASRCQPVCGLQSRPPKLTAPRRGSGGLWPLLWARGSAGCRYQIESTSLRPLKLSSREVTSRINLLVKD